MKKLFLTFGLITMSGAAFAQGIVNWSAIPFNAMTVQTNTTQGSPLFGDGVTGIGGGLAAGGFYFELLYAPYTGAQAPVPTTLAELAAWSDAGLEAQSSASAGKLAPINPDAGATVPWAAGTTDSIVLVGWSANLGSTWSAAEAEIMNQEVWFAWGAYLGFSATGYIAPVSYSPGAMLFGPPTAQGVPIYNPPSNPMELYPIFPEPSTLALAGLGGLVLLLFRRRK